MTTKRVLYLATITDGVVEYEGPASLDDIREVLRKEGLIVEVAYKPAADMAVGTMAPGQSLTTPWQGFTALGSLPFATDSSGLRSEFEPKQHDEGEKKEPNGSNGHGEHHDTERPPAGMAAAPSVRPGDVVFTNPWPNQQKRIGYDGSNNSSEPFELTVDDVADKVAARLEERASEKRTVTIHKGTSVGMTVCAMPLSARLRELMQTTKPMVKISYDELAVVAWVVGMVGTVLDEQEAPK